MSNFDRTGTSRFIRTAALALSVAVLSACGSLTGIKDIPEYLDSDFEHVGPRDFITSDDLTKIKLGMSPLQVQNRLGMPMLSGKDQKDRWDYVLKKGQGAEEEFVPYAVYFKSDKVVRIAPLTPPPPGVAQAAADAPEVDTSAVVAPESSAGEVMAPEPSLAVGADVGDAAEINDMLSNWAAAWSAKDVKGYFAFYADTFEHGKKSRATWENQRRARLSNKETISVIVSDVQIDLQSETLAIVKFRQDYSSNRYKDSGIKVLTLSKASGNWKIQTEEFQK
ncbi:MAG: outer membrane protein assembly factor BamE [Burkholderiales bacterium]|uniref:L,D-transpeptidase Cds6 family protein n=1 Tax=Limnobacter sp. TaxID=2003368 RepID=UPI0039BC8662|nr:outer membrane protein assembly factor BamE [Burkholderiales bacterium]